MGKKLKSNSSLSTQAVQNTEFSPEYRAAKAMFLLNEDMRYFGSVNGLFRGIIDVKKEILCRIGRPAWNKMTQEELDKTINKYFVNSYMEQSAESSFNLSSDISELTDSLLHKSKNKLAKSRRDSFEFIMEDDHQDGFSGPFSWKTRSLEDLSFPSTPETEAKLKKRPTSPVPLATKEQEQQNGAQEELDVIPYLTLDELRQELKKNYEEAKAARLKMQEMKSPASKNAPEGITKAAVNARLGSRKLASVVKRPELNGMPLSPADLKPASALRPVNQDRLKSNASANDTHLNEIRQFHFRSPPEPLPRPKNHSRSGSSSEQPSSPVAVQDVVDDFERACSNGSHSGKSPRHASSLNSTIRSPRRDSASVKSDKSPRRHSSASRSSRSGSFSKSKPESPEKSTLKEISEGLNQSHETRALQSPNGAAEADNLMELFKNW
eukprot:gene20495-22511_t